MHGGAPESELSPFLGGRKLYVKELWLWRGIKEKIKKISEWDLRGTKVPGQWRRWTMKTVLIGLKVEERTVWNCLDKQSHNDCLIRIQR